MKQEIQKKIDELHAALKEHAPDCTVTFKLFINCAEVSCGMSFRTPAQLKSQGISMRNLAGNFIHD